MEGALGVLPAQLVPWLEKPGFQACWPSLFRQGTCTFFFTLPPWAGSLTVPVAQMLWIRPHTEAAQRAFQGQVQRQAPLAAGPRGRRLGMDSAVGKDPALLRCPSSHPTAQKGTETVERLFCLGIIYQTKNL